MTEQVNQEQLAQDTQFMIQRVYIKDLSFEAPNTPTVFQQKWEPQLSLDLNVEHTAMDADVYEVVLTVTAAVKNQHETAFLAEVKQAGIFTIQGAPQEQLDHLLGSFCPNILFPYAREVISAEVLRGSFPQLVLAPINFDAIYAQQLAEKQQHIAPSTVITQPEVAH